MRDAGGLRGYGGSEGRRVNKVELYFRGGIERHVDGFHVRGARRWNDKDGNMKWLYFLRLERQGKEQI